MVSVFNQHPKELIGKTTEKLKSVKEISPPQWSNYVKTGASRERPPVEKDWWYTRAASVLRKVYINGPIGVSKLRVKYGSKKRRGHKPARFVKGSGGIIRKILQQLEQAELVTKAGKGVHKGRVVTPKGRSFLDKLSK